jgi:hypothetical protein
MTIIREPAPIQYDDQENSLGRAERERRHAEDVRAYRMALEQAQRQQEADKAKAEADAEAERARTAEIEANQKVRDAGTQAVRELLRTRGAAASAACDKAKAAFEAAMPDDSVDLVALSKLWTTYRHASAVQAALVGEGLRYVAQMGGDLIQRPTDKLALISFSSVWDETIAVRCHEAVQRAASLAVEVASKAQEEALAKLDAKGSKQS